MHKPEAILFDWDNTLVDSWPVIIHCLTQTFEAMGKTPWPEEDIRAGRQNIHHSVRASFPGIFGEEWERARHVYLDYFSAIHLEKLRVLPEAEELLNLLKAQEIPCAVVSNKTGEKLRLEVSHLGWDHYFHRVIGAMDAVEDKPSAAPLHLAMEGLALSSPEAVWMVGDSETDLEAAQNARCKPVLFGSRAWPTHLCAESSARFDSHAHLLAHAKIWPSSSAKGATS